MKYTWFESLKMLLYKEPVVQEVVEEPVKPDLVVGEPVLSFVALVNSNPSRFKMRYRRVHPNDSHASQTIFDKITKEWFWMRCYYYGYIDSKYYSNVDFLTQDEMEYIDINISREYNIKVRNRYDRITEVKAKRLDLEARQRLVDIYCNPEQI